MHDKKSLCSHCSIANCLLYEDKRMHPDREEQPRILLQFHRGQEIYHQGSPAQVVHCVRSGRVKLSTSDSGGNEALFRIVGVGELFGFRALLANEDHATTAEAMEDTLVCTIRDRLFRALLAQSPYLSLRLLEELARGDIQYRVVPRRRTSE